jgi:hypothetical protein
MSDVSYVLLEDQRPLGEMIEEALSAQVFEGGAVEFAEGHGPIKEFEDGTWNHGITTRCQLHAHSRGREGLGQFLSPSWKHYNSAVLTRLFTQGGRLRLQVRRPTKSVRSPGLCCEGRNTERPGDPHRIIRRAQK